MRVLCVTNMYPTEAEPVFGSFVRELVEDLTNLGVDVDVFAFDGRRRKRAYIAAARKLRRLLRDGSFDIAHAHYGLTGALAVTQRRVPTVVTFHGSDTGYVRWQAWVSWFVARLATPIFVSREGARLLGCANAAVIPAGIDPERFRPRSVSEARAALGWSHRGRLVLLPGSRANVRKGADLFDAVMREVHRRAPDVESVSLEGFRREQVADVMNAVDVTLMTSHFEGSPVAIKESLACMTPVVSVPVGDLPEILAGLPGCAVVPRDAPALATAVLAALDAGGDPALRRRALLYSGRRVAERTVALYEGVLARRRSS